MASQGFRIASAFVDIKADAAGLRQDIKTKVENAAKGVKAKFEIKLDERGLKTSIKAAIEKAARGVKAKFDLEVNTKGLRAKIKAAVENSSRGVKGSVGLKVDSRGLRNEVRRAVLAATAGMRGTVNITGDSSGVANSTKQMSRWLRITRAIAIIGPPALAAMDHALRAMGPSTAVLVPILTSVATLITTAVVGTKNLGDSFRKSFIALSSLSPAAFEFTRAVQGVGKAWGSIRLNVQEELFKGLGAQFETMSAATLPSVNVGLQQMGVIMNSMAGRAMAMMQELGKTGQLKQMFSGLSKSMIPMIDIPGQILNAMVKLSIAATPLWTRMTTAMGRSMDKMTAKLNAAFADGSLEKSISKSGDAIVRFFRNIANNPAWQQFVSNMKETGPVMAAAFSTIAEAALRLVNAFSPLAGAGIRIAEGLAHIVNALPPEFITIVLGVALAFKTWGIIAGGITRTSTAIRGLGISLGALTGASAGMTALSTAGIAVTGSLTTATTALGLFLAALGTVAIIGGAFFAIDKLFDQFEAAPPKVEKLTNSLIAFKKTGTLSGEGARVLGSDFSKLRDAMDRVAHPGVLERINDGLHEIVTAGFGTRDSLDEARKTLEGTDKALAGLANNGNFDMANSLFKTMFKESNSSATSIEKFKGLLPEWTKASENAKAAQDLLAMSMGVFGDKAVSTASKLDQQKASADALKMAYMDLNNAMLQMSGGELAFEAALDAASASLKENGKTLNVNTKAGRDNKQTLMDIASTTMDWASKTMEATGNYSQASAIWDRGRQSLIDLAFDMTNSKTKAKELADQWLSMPSKELMLKANSEDLKVKIADAKAKIKDLEKQRAEAKLGADKKALDAKLKEARADLKDLEAKKATAKIDGNIANLTKKIDDGQKRIDALKQHKPAELRGERGNVNRAVDAAQRKIDGLKQKRDAQIKARDATAGGVGSAKRNINSVVGKTVDIRVVTTYSSVGMTRASHGGAKGGLAPQGLRKFARGGGITGGVLQGIGTKTSDSLIARLSRGEFVMRASAVEKYGARFMSMVNSGMFPKFAKGGLSDSAKSARSGLTNDITLSDISKLSNTIRNPEIRGFLGRPTDKYALVDALNKLQRDVNAAKFSSGTTRSLQSKITRDGKTLVRHQENLEAVNKSLDKAKEALDDVKGKFDQLSSSVSDNIRNTGNITTIGQYGTSPQVLLDKLAKDSSRATAFAGMLDQLRDKGVNANIISDIASSGVIQGSNTAASLLRATPEQLAEFNALQKTLSATADRTGRTVANAMYGAGLSSAQGLVDGLTSQQKTIEAAMLALAVSMETALKKALGIKSPSRVMMPIGQFTAEGFAQGAKKSKKPDEAMRFIAHSAVRSSIGAVPQNGSARGGDVIIENLCVDVKGTYDMHNPHERRKVAKAMVVEIQQALRDYEKERR